MDQNLITTAKNTVTQNGYTSYLIAQVKRSEGKLSSADLISINNRCLMILNQKGTKITNIFSWLTLSTIKYKKPKLKFYFQKTKYSIIISEENILKTVSEALQKILLSRELKSVGWTGLNLPSIPYTPYSATNRIIERAHLQKNKISQDSIEKIFSVLIYSQPELYINEIPNILSFIDIFFESLPLFPNLYNIAISKAEKFDPYSALINYVPYLKELKRFEIMGPKTDSFSDFFKAFSKHQHIHLFSVSFRGSELDEKDLTIIHDFLIGRSIKGVEFHKAIKKEAIPSFFQFFFDKDLLDNLRSLNVSESIGIDINRLIPKLNNIQVLSLARCEIEIGDALKKLSSLNNLKMLDLSNNPFRVKLTSMPPNLTSLYLNSVTWSDQTLFYFISHLPNHYMTISMCYAQASAGEWGAFYSYLPTLHGNFGIESFAFDGNRVHQNLFNFLNENNRLYYLSLNGCFAENDSESISALCKFVSSSRSLESLIVRGGKNLFLGRNVESVISAVIHSKNVNFLDISDNRSGDFAINQLRQILTVQNHLETLVFDGLIPTSKGPYIDFIKNAMCNRNLELSFPLHDLMQLMNKKEIQMADVVQIKDLFAGRNETGTIFKKYPNYNAFPLYLRKDKVSQLSEPAEIIKVKPQSSNQKKNQNQTKTQPQQKSSNQNQQKKPNKNKKPNTNQNQQKNTQEQQQLQQQQQIQQLQQQLQLQQLQQQQLQQQLQQQIQNQNQNQSQPQNQQNNQKRNTTTKKQLIVNLNKKESPNKNISGPEPTLIVENDDEYDQYDAYNYTTYDDYHTESIVNINNAPASNRPINNRNTPINNQPNNNRNSNNNNQLNTNRNIFSPQYDDDYIDEDYPYEELDYSPIEDIKRQKLPARPKSATRYRNEMNNDIQNRPNNNSKPVQSNRPQSARKQPRTASQRRPQSTRRSGKRQGRARKPASGRTSRNNERRPPRSASACQMRKSSTRNQKNNNSDDDFESYLNDTQNQQEFDYYSDEFEQPNNDRRRQTKSLRPTSAKTPTPANKTTRKGNNGKKNILPDDYDYETQIEDTNENRPLRRDFQATNNNNAPIFVDEYNDYSEYDYNERSPIQQKSSKRNQIVFESEPSFEDEEAEMIKNKVKPALRTKSRFKKNVSPKKSNKNSETATSPTKPAIKEFQKQNKMKLRQAQLRQQIHHLEEEDKKEPNETSTTVNSPITKDNIFAESNIETTYDIPTWSFPIKMKFEFDDKRTFKIEQIYSTEKFIEEIMKNNNNPKSYKLSKKSS